MKYLFLLPLLCFVKPASSQESISKILWLTDTDRPFLSEGTDSLGAPVWIFSRDSIGSIRSITAYPYGKKNMITTVKINGFEMIYIPPKGEELTCQKVVGASIGPSAMRLVRKLRPGDKLIIRGMSATDSAGRVLRYSNWKWKIEVR